MPILKLDKDDPKKELEFDVKCGLEVKQGDRIRKLLMFSESLLKLAKKYAAQRPYQIIKRPLG